MSDTPSPSKVKLVELVEAYASAKSTANESLVRMAAGGLSSFLAGHDVVALEPVEAPTEEV
jgi:hypothetical protein